MKQKSKKVEREITETIGNKCIEGNPTPAQLDRLYASAVKSGITSEAATDLYNQEYAKLVGKAVKANLEQLALNGVLNSFRREIKKKEFTPTNTAKQVVGFITADGGIYDKLAIMRSVASNKAQKDGPVAAQEEGLVNADNKVLDTRQKIFGKPNANFGKPLKEREHDMSRTLDVIVRVNGSTEWVYTTIQSNDPATIRGWDRVRFMKLAQTFANVKTVVTNKLSKAELAEMDEEAIKAWNDEHSATQLSSSQAKDTPSTWKAVVDDSINVEQVFFDVTDKMLTPMQDIDAIHEEIKNAKGRCPFDKRFFVDGIVTWINRDRPDYFGRITMGLMSMEDESVEIRVKIPKTLPIEFGEQSEVRVIGKSMYFQQKDEANDTWVNADTGLEALAIVVKMAAPKDNTQDEQTGEVAAIIGWED